jgi:hypothetical protein
MYLNAFHISIALDLYCISLTTTLMLPIPIPPPRRQSLWRLSKDDARLPLRNEVAQLWRKV